MKYDFIEIGTSNFETLIELASDSTVGISVEPISAYLNSLPNKPLVRKINAAISVSDTFSKLSVFYIPEAVIQKNNLPDWLKGCNCVGNYHYQHVAMGIESLVVEEEISCIPIGYLFESNHVEAVDYLKMDTEGSDAEIIMHLSAYLANKPVTVYPKVINFESNQLTTSIKIEQAVQSLQKIGYALVYSSHDTRMEYK